MADDDRQNGKGQRVLWRLSRQVDCELETYLEQASGVDRRAVLYCLLKREVNYRLSFGETVAREDYESQFEGDEELLDAVFVEKESVCALLDGCGYELVEEIAASRCGEVYKIRDKSRGSIRAATIIPGFLVRKDLPDGESEEVAELDYLVHPLIARPIEVIESKGNILLVTEYVDGFTFRRVVDTIGPLSFGAAAELVRQAAHGLSQLHDRFKAHGALLPTSLLLCTKGREAGTVKVCDVALADFGDLRLAPYAPPFPGSGLSEWFWFTPPECTGETFVADARCDVYGLGCTLLYLLAGPRPKGTPYSRSLAGDATRIASLLVESRTDCPRELEAIVSQMMAEDPDARFATAAEVVDALRPFASAKDVRDLLPRLKGAGVEREQPDAVNQPWKDTLGETASVHSPSAPAQERLPAVPEPSKAASEAEEPKLTSDRTSAPTDEKRRWPRPSKRMVFVTSLAVSIVVLCIWLAGKSPSRSDRFDVRSLPDWAAALVELPGPGGDWWFEEIPWYGPAVRFELARCIAASKAPRGRSALKDMERLAKDLTANPKPEMLRDLKLLSHVLAEELDGSERSVVKQLLEITPDEFDIGQLRGLYGKLAAEMDESTLTTSTGWHLRALLRHFTGEYDEAKGDYEKALDAYRADANDALEALCAMDYGHLLYTKRQDYLKAKRHFSNCLKKARSPGLKIACLSDKANVNRKLGQFSEARDLLDESVTLANDPGTLQLNPNHSLRAVIHETLGWTALDEWRLVEADGHFLKAREIREQVRSNPRHKRAILWIRQARAMIAHFRGEQSNAQQLYREALDDIPRLQLSDLSARRPNLYERLADTYLFGDPVDYEEAKNALDRAIHATNDPSFDREALWPHVIALKAKYAICLLRMHRDLLYVEQFFKQEVEEKIKSHSEVLGTQLRIYEPTVLVAKSLMQMREGGNESDKRQSAIESLQSQFLKATSKTSRQNLDLMMLVVGEILAPRLLDDSSVGVIVRRLDDVCLQLHGQDKVAGTFLRPYLRPAITVYRSQTFERQADDSQRLKRLKEIVTAAEPRHIQQMNSQIAASGVKGATILLNEDLQPKDCQLFYLTVGVSDYRDNESITDLEFADDDARDLAEAIDALCIDPSSETTKWPNRYFRRGLLAGQAADPKRDRDQYILVDSEATRENILTRLGWLAEVVQPTDLCVVALSGHGKVVDGDFYFLPHDYAKGKVLRDSAIRRDRLMEELERIPGNTLLVLDACHSGAVAITGVKDADDGAWDALRDFQQASSGVMVIGASLSSQKAREDSRLKQGLLTCALIEAFSGSLFDAGGVAPRTVDELAIDGRVSLLELQYYLTARVHQLSRGSQNPVLNRLGGDLNLRSIPLRPAHFAPALSHVP